MARGVHPKKEVRKALKELRAAGWTIDVTAGRGHRRGIATCPHQHPDDAGRLSQCVVGIDCTPRNQGDHANRIRRALRKCRDKTNTI